MPSGVYKRIIRPRELIIKNDYAIVPLTQGQFAKIDLEDIIRVNQYNWWAVWYENIQTYYARGIINNKNIGLHRFILNVTNPKIQVDHRDGNGLENRRFNIRVCTSQQNAMNQQSKKNSSSKFKGVAKIAHKWQAQITYNYKKIYLGCFDDEKIAAKIYNEKAKELFGEFARLNEV